MAALLAALALAPSALAAPVTNRTAPGHHHHGHHKREEWGPSHLQEICRTTDDLCHRFGTIAGAPVDHADPSVGEWDLKYFVNSDFWDPVNKPNGPIFFKMWYGGTTAPGYSNSMVGSLQPNEAGLLRQFPGVSEELAEELGALIISVPNRYYGCESARAGAPEGGCPTSLEAIPAGEAGTLEAHERLRHLSLLSVVDDIAFVARETISTYAEDWGMVIPADASRAPNSPIVFGCSWPGAAAVYARMTHPQLFPGAVATSHPLSSSPAGNPFYRTFVGSVYELYSAGGSLECRNVLTVGHEEIRRRILETGVDVTPSGSCFRGCTRSTSVNEDFGVNPETYRSFGSGIPGLPGVQTINRNCSTVGCNIERTCEFILSCFEDEVDTFEHPFPIQSDDPVAAGGAYQCLKDFSEVRRSAANHPSHHHEADEEEEQRSLMEFKPEEYRPAADLGPRVYESNTLTYQMFGFRGPLWMTQTCDDNSGCPFVRGLPGGAALEQTNSWLYNSFGPTVAGQSEEDFIAMMRADAGRFQQEMGGQRPWEAMPSSDIYMSYNDADPWTAPGVFQQMPPDSDLVYDLAGGGISHCVDPAVGAQEYIRRWAGASPAEDKDL